MGNGRNMNGGNKGFSKEQNSKVKVDKFCLSKISSDNLILLTAALNLPTPVVMDTTGGDQTPLEDGHPTRTNLPRVSYANSLKPTSLNIKTIPLKQEEVNQMIINENLEYVVIGKFSYGWPDRQDLRRLIPKQCELKGDYKIGLLSNRHWEPMFNPDEETTTIIAWISFPSLPPNFFGKETVFSLVATEFPKRIKIGTKKETGEVVEKWVLIKYDYVPKYCKTCMIQGHNEEQCYVEHPKLYPKVEKTDKNIGDSQRDTRKNQGTDSHINQ
ncbi:hypothetical protein H5410_036768 [Solanum commersonii]|uniref:DUF4283 domain-containing protein n=1 Tax=Solanum commersonii TaxID=4109 RepID=A0A9J5Y7I5_SOLCO|nr:hypothetical protein H5410_036768 [Solanum commersonii]